MLAPLLRTPLHPQWLVYRHEPDWFRRIGAVATGRVLDIGCGHKRIYRSLPQTCEYLSLDYPLTGEGRYGSRPDVFCDAAVLPLADGAVDTVLLLDVLEHVADAGRALNEARRVLRGGGHLIISVPFLYPLHDAPQDFRRWTRFGLEREAQQGGFTIVELNAYGKSMELAALVTNLAFSSLCLRLLERCNPLALLLLPLLVLTVPLLNILGLVLSRLDPQDEMAACGYRAIFIKTPGEPD